LALVACGVERFELLPSTSSIAADPPREPLPFEPEPATPASPAAPELPAAGDGAVPASSSGEELPPEPDVVRPPEAGCQKIDLLFAIDNSSSMDDEQENLARSFPGFIRVMQQVLGTKDVHIMVVSTGGDREDEDEPALDAEACEEIQGAGRRTNADGVDCGIQGGLSFMSAEQPDLEGTFSCAAQVGTDGSAIEEPMDAVLAATGAALNGRGRCNAGFLRDDALLVVTVITDEEDERSSGEPDDWRNILLDVKRGDADALVLLGLVGDNNVDGGLLGGPCSAADADGAPRLQELVDSASGVLGSVCAADYAPFFQTAVGTIDSACNDFVPPIPF
jgi:hypothetical protein